MTEDHGKSRIDSFRRATARRLRASTTEPEDLLWRALRRVPTLGTHFRRQVPIGPYVADFACLGKRLVIEVDGSQHGLPGNEQKDSVRTAWLESEGYTVLRFWNSEVVTDIDSVIDGIYGAMYGSDDVKRMKHRRTRAPADASFTPPRRASRSDPPPPGEGEDQSDA